MDLKLSQFPTRNCIFMRIKNSQGLTKRIKLGADTFESNKLTIILDPYKDVDSYAWKQSKSGGIVLRQDVKGPIRLKITSDILIEGVANEPPSNYLYSEIRVRENNVWVKRSVYVAL